MATALAKGFLDAGLASKESTIAADPFEPARVSFKEKTDSRITDSNQEVVRNSDLIFLAVKPYTVELVLKEIAEDLSNRHLIISIAAGITLTQIESCLPESIRVIRVMPNTPVLVGVGASAFSLGKKATHEDSKIAMQLLSAVGIAYEVAESLLNAVTGLSGSGPAYGYLMIEAMSDGGVAAGLPREVATRLAAQTLQGSAAMVLETGLHTGQLKDMVTSPGGTTIEGIHQLEKGGVRCALMNAVQAATEKATALGKE
jgi:pyrroline-5-carboxylate reductase